MLQLLTREAPVTDGNSAGERPTLSLTWTLDPHTGKPVGRWIIDETQPALRFASAA